jgi:cell wall-active antibiotic response 4TMS protein YvqF
MPTGVRPNAPHLVIGLCVMALGVALVLDRLGVFPAEQILRYWPVGLILFGASIMWQALIAAADGTINGRRQDIPIGPAIWLVLLGLFFTHTFERRGSAEHSDNSENVRVFAVMSGDQRTNTGARFRGAEMTSLMGGARLDLREAQLPPGESAVVDVFAMMGGAVLMVPKGWTVDMQATSILGGIKDERFREASEGREGRGRGRPRRSDDQEATAPAPPASTAAPATNAPAADGLAQGQPDVPLEKADSATPPGNAPRLIVRGFVMMGGLVIKS